MVYETWQKLKNTNSRTEKQQILMKAKEDFFKFAYYVLNPYMKYGISSKSVYCNEDYFGEPNKETYELLENLHKRKYGRKEAVERINAHIKKYGRHILLALDKKLDCGVTAKTINKVHKGKWVIPSFEVQLAKEVTLAKLDWPMYAEPKMDGVRVLAIITNKIITFATRNGRTFSAPLIEDKIMHLDNVVIDGEFIYGEGKQENRTSISGLINSALAGSPIRDSNVQYRVFDILPLEHFKWKISSLSYEERRRMLKKHLPDLAIESIKVNNEEEANQLFENLLKQGYEGLILKKPKHTYKFKRSEDWIKMKAINTADLKCIDVIEGTGKYEGMVGALVCKGEVQGIEVFVKVGSGLTDSDRAKDFNYYIGKTIEIKYNSIVKNPEGYSLFLPRFVCVRSDK